VEPFRRELKAHCYRMSGSPHDAEDLLQESLLKAWKGLPRFEGRSSVRTWLYTVATSACLTAAEQRGARALASQRGPPSRPGVAMAPQPEVPWLEPYPEAWLDAPAAASPEARYSQRQSVTLAFLAALQRLPPRQRAVLLLRDVLGWQASECVELLEMSVAAVNSALQRARDTLESSPGVALLHPDDEETRALLRRYVQAWEQADVGALVTLLRDDAQLTMPPMPQWFEGAAEIGAAIGGMVLTPGSTGRFKLVPTRANAQPAVAMFARTEAGGWEPQSVHVLTVEGGRIARIDACLDARLPLLFAPAPG
jgi:RNA polymerase sigma-70 factor (ECF subfamily)